MFASLRSRLWLTNAIVIVFMLGISGLVVVLFARSVPIRTTNIRLQEVSSLLIQQEELAQLQVFRQENVLKNLSERFNVRILVVAPNGAVQVDTDTGQSPPLRRFNLPQRNDRPSHFPTNGTVRDAENRVWQYSLQPLGENRFLIVAAARPAFQWLNLFTDEFLPTLLWAAGIAVLLAVVLSWLTARGVSRPLKEISDATIGIPQGAYQKIEVGGPIEVRRLAASFNSMVDKVTASRQAQQDFVANVSHELKTPLTSIQGFAQAILDGTVQDQAGLENAANVIYAEAGRMHRLVVALLDLTRLDSGVVNFERSAIDLGMLLENIAHQFKPKARAARVEISLDLAPMPALMGDGDRLAQVFTNLLDNGIEHTPPEGKIHLQARQVGREAEIRVTDSGAGIPEQDLDRIFERFYQVDKSRARRGAGGTGLGLAIAKEIVEGHGGTISVSSRQGYGSEFVVKIPLVFITR